MNYEKFNGGNNNNPTLNITLNKRLKPVETKGGDPKYPLYFQLNYLRKNTRFPVFEIDISAKSTYPGDIKFHLSDVEFITLKNKIDEIELGRSVELRSKKKFKDFEYFVYSNMNAVIKTVAELKKIILNIAEREISNQNSDFEIAGFSHVIYRYLDNFLFSYDLDLAIEIEDFIMQFLDRKIVEYAFGDQGFISDFDGFIKIGIENKLPKDIIHKIETTLVWHAFVSESWHRNLCKYDLLFSKDTVTKDFQIFFYKHKLQDQKNDDRILLPIENPFSRHIKIFPPNSDPDSYINTIYEYIEDF